MIRCFFQGTGCRWPQLYLAVENSVQEMQILSLESQQTKDLEELATMRRLVDDTPVVCWPAPVQSVCLLAVLVSQCSSYE